MKHVNNKCGHERGINHSVVVEEAKKEPVISGGAPKTNTLRLRENDLN